MPRYRFDNCIGQSGAAQFLQNAVRTGRVPHALILCGEKGIGKMDLAMAFASALQCAEVSPAADTRDNCNRRSPLPCVMEPCGHCRPCRQVAAGSHPDVILVTNERAGAETKTNTIGVKTARFVQNDVCIKPYEGPYKIYIIPDAHNLNPQAQNALLKTLEEPPSYAVLLLLTQSTANFLPTVLSRCITLRLYPAPEEELVKDLLGKRSGEHAREKSAEEVSPMRSSSDEASSDGNYDDKAPALSSDLTPSASARNNVSPDRALLCARLSHGNPGRCRELAYREELWAFRGHFIEFMKSLSEATSYDIVQYAEQLTRKEDSHTDDFLDFGLSWFRDILTAKSCGESDGTLIFADEITYINKVKEQYSYSALESILNAFDDAQRRRAAKGNDTQILEVLLLKIRRAMGR